MARIDSGAGPIQVRPAALHRFGECGVLRQEAVAGMNRVGAARRRDFEQPVGAQIAVLRARAADRIGLVGLERVRATGVGLGIDGHALEAEAAAATR